MKVAFQKIIKEANFLSLSGNITIAFFGIASFAILTRSFPIDVFGQWVLYITAGNFIDMFRFGITNTAVVRYLSGVDKDERMKFIGSNGLIGLAATAGIAVILWTCHFAFGEPIKHAGYELFLPGTLCWLFSHFHSIHHLW